MKLSFALLLLDGTGIPVTAQAVNVDPYAGANQLPELLRLAQMLAIPTLNPAQLQMQSIEALQNTVVFVAGSPTAKQLTDAVADLTTNGATPILLVDALQNRPQLMGSLHHLSEKRYQSALVAHVRGLVRNSRLMLYEFAKGDATTTLVVVINAGTPQAAILTIERALPPFQGCRSFPGGFLDPHLENLPQCISREGSEETNTNVPTRDLILLDVRSDVGRDHRGHVVDHGYMWLVPAALTEHVLKSVRAGDDASQDSAKFVSVKSVLEERAMAFDHYDLLLAAVRTGKVLPPARPLLKLVRRCMSWLEGIALRLEKSDAVFGRFHQR
ncbi:MAG: NUDIX hydrolase [Candidatus Obscuribacter sp.]|nr:NUDIX hydrolase [Candidatus Obscuribacter sp.]